MQTLKNKIVLITGASSGIGEACAKQFAACGIHLIITARRIERIKKLAIALKKEHQVEVLPIQLDVQDKEQVAKAIRELPTNWQAIDILVNNAGLALGSDKIQNGDIDLSGSDIRVTEINPGLTHTEFSEIRWKSKERSDRFYSGFTPLCADDIADTVLYCATRPAHVNIEELLVFPTAQASVSLVHKKKQTTTKDIFE